MYLLCVLLSSERVSSHSYETLRELQYDFVDVIIFLSFPLQSVIFYAVQSPKLDQWLRSDVLREQLKSVHDPQYTDIDRTFYQNIDEDYDLRHGGISKTTYLNCYLAWIQYCALRKDPVSNEMLGTTMQWKLLQRTKLFLLIFYSFQVQL